MKECKKCNRTFEDSVTFCPFCGNKLESEEPQVFNDNNLNIQQPLPPEKVLGYVIKRKLVIILGSLISILPFFITGFSFFFTWYILIGIVLFLVYLVLASKDNTEGDTEDDLYAMNVLLIIFIVIAGIMYLWGPLNPDY